MLIFLNCVCITSGCLFGELAERNSCLQLGVALLQKSQGLMFSLLLFVMILGWLLGQLLSSGNPILGTLTGLEVQRAGS